MISHLLPFSKRGRLVHGSQIAKQDLTLSSQRALREIIPQVRLCPWQVLALGTVLDSDLIFCILSITLLILEYAAFSRPQPSSPTVPISYLRMLVGGT